MKKYYIGLDIGGTKCALTLAYFEKESIEIIYKKRFETKEQPPKTVLNLFCDIIYEALSELSLSLSDITRIGISCGGPLDAYRGIVMSPPHLPGWDDVHITEYFEKKLGIPTVLCNDADACVLAEWKFGAGKGCKNLVFFTCGTGFGSGFIFNGALYMGTGLGCEIGHISLRKRGPVGFGKVGTSEAFCSGAALGEAGKRRVRTEQAKGKTPYLLRKAGTIENIDARLICETAKNEKDPLCLSLCRTFAKYIGEVSSIVIDMLDPEMIIIGSVYARNVELFEPTLLDTVKKETLKRIGNDCRILPAKLGDSIGDYAALSVAITQNKTI